LLFDDDFYYLSFVLDIFVFKKNPGYTSAPYKLNVVLFPIIQFNEYNKLNIGQENISKKFILKYF
jgi:hypothetical protein